MKKYMKSDLNYSTFITVLNFIDYSFACLVILLKEKIIEIYKIVENYSTISYEINNSTRQPEKNINPHSTNPKRNVINKDSRCEYEKLKNMPGSSNNDHKNTQTKESSFSYYKCQNRDNKENKTGYKDSSNTINSYNYLTLNNNQKLSETIYLNEKNFSTPKREPNYSYKYNDSASTNYSSNRESYSNTPLSQNLNNLCYSTLIKSTGPLKKDGTPDMRYNVNRVNNPGGLSYTMYGERDMRYSINQSFCGGPLKKDGTPDMRYSVNKMYYK